MDGAFTHKSRIKVKNYNWQLAFLKEKDSQDIEKEVARGVEVDM
jgi:pyruvate kinase